MKQGEFYVFTHSEFREDLQELSSDILEALPGDQPEARRAAFEEARRERYKKGLIAD